MLTRNCDLFFKTLQSELIEVQNIQSGFKEFSKNLVVRQIQNINVDNVLDKKKIEEMIDENPEVVSKIPQEKIFGKASCQIQNAAQDIFEKCEGIKRLQSQVKELLEMIKEIAIIVSAQSKQIDSIGLCIIEAKDYVESGRVRLVKAKEHQETAQCVY